MTEIRIGIMLRIQIRIRIQWGVRRVPVCFGRGRFEKRRYSRTRDGDELWETVDVKCGSSGNIGVDLYNAKALSNPNTPLIIYLPPTGTHARSSHPPIPSPLLHPSTSLARINYRWNNTSSSPQFPNNTPSNSPFPSPNPFTPTSLTHPFPTPLHDVFHAYTYLSSLQSQSQPSPFHTRTPAFPRLKPQIQRPVIVYGSFLSGALATSLALTESWKKGFGPREGMGVGMSVRGLIVKDGVFDFSELALFQAKETEEGKLGREERGDIGQGEGQGEGRRGRGGRGGWNEKQLHSMKKQLFSSPAGTFDSFASPVFFFRTAGVHVPKFWPGEEEELLTENKNENAWKDGFVGFDGDGEPIFENDISSPSTPNSNSTKAKEEEEEGSSIKAAMSTPPPTSPRTSELDLFPPLPKKAPLRFPPLRSNLVIPSTLFLYTSTSTSSPSNPNPTSSSQATKSPKRRKTRIEIEGIKKEMGLGGMNPESQAKEMRALMVRSVRLHEAREGDLDLDLEGAEGRVGIVGLGIGGEGVGGVEGEEEEDEVVGEWIEGLVGDGKG